jgi:hypothetical protein
MWLIGNVKLDHEVLDLNRERKVIPTAGEGQTNNLNLCEPIAELTKTSPLQRRGPEDLVHPEFQLSQGLRRDISATGY